MQREFWDISVPVTSALPIWPESDGFVLTSVSDLLKGDPVNESHIALGVHVGTHIDAPLHFIPGGDAVDQLSFDALIGPAEVVEVACSDVITAAHLKDTMPEGTTRLLLKTPNSEVWPESSAFNPNYVSIAEDAAEWLVKVGVQLVGIDYLSVERFGGTGDVHRTLLGAGIVVVEGLNLKDVEQGSYWLTCLPIRLTGAEGAPARAVLTRSESQGGAA